LPPVHTTNDDYDGGYIMGYVLFADWGNASLDCMIPFLAESSETIKFDSSKEIGSDGCDKSPGTKRMEVDLRANTYAKFAEIVKERTGHPGKVGVNRTAYIEQYRLK
ncbi:hypothetical protein JYT72_01010, partial [Crocinitomix catalasitica]|nr:hypothetical protein [Crocinitomix catalasitica]